MHCGEDDSPPYIESYRPGPYSYSRASSAASSTASVWSDASSQTSDDSSVTSESSECFTSHNTAATNVCEPVTVAYWPKHKLPVEVAPEQRQHPRRSSASGCPPSLVRQCDRKVSFVDNLVGKNDTSSAKSVRSITVPSRFIGTDCRSNLAAFLGNVPQ